MLGGFSGPSWFQNYEVVADVPLIPNYPIRAELIQNCLDASSKSNGSGNDDSGRQPPVLDGGNQSSQNDGSRDNSGCQPPVLNGGNQSSQNDGSRDDSGRQQPPVLNNRNQNGQNDQHDMDITDDDNVIFVDVNGNQLTKSHCSENGERC